jgi:hypothetical protein
MRLFRGHPVPRAIIRALVVGLILVAAPVTPSDDNSGICVGGLELVACVPPESP